ncbi:MAG: tetratricopeptide repeat protein [Desulfovibrionaceae bacterium]
MLATPGKTVREHFARARSTLSRDEVLKAVSAAINGLEHCINSRIMGKEKMEIEALISDFLGDFNRHPVIREYFYAHGVHAMPFIKYAKGKENKLLEKFETIERDMTVAEKQAEEQAEKQQEQRKEELLQKGQECLDQEDFPRGKGALRRAAEAYGDEPGLLVDIADRLYKAKQWREAAEFAERAMEKFRMDPKPYSVAVQAYMQMREFEACENVFLKVLKQFGAHPRTYQSMSRMYLEWRNYDKAYDFAKQALEQDPDLKIAKEIVEKVGKRMFSNG